MSYKILIVDDNDMHLKASELLLRSRGYNNIETAPGGVEAIEKIKTNPWKYGIVILDYRMNGKDGIETTKSILSITNNLYILIHSADKTQEVAIASMNAGAVGFIPKAAGAEVFLERVDLWRKKYEQTFLAVSSPSLTNEYLRIISSAGLVGASKAFADVISLAQRYARLKDTVLIEGETGTGKERIARLLHLGQPHLFFPVNCASWNGSTELMESELFGHLKGAFTGADSRREGIFQSAQGGTIELDEIDALSISAQQKLLRVLREKTVRPVGCDVEYKIDFRLVVTAKPGIEERCNEGKFMPDFFERLNVLRLYIPPLRERRDDIGPLVAHFCEAYEKETGIKKRFLVQTLQYFEKYDWPRNVAQLENMVRRLCARTEDATIEPKHLGEEFFKDRHVIPLSYQLKTIAKEEMVEAVKRASSRREASRTLGIPETTLRRKPSVATQKRPVVAGSKPASGFRDSAANHQLM